MTQNLWDSTKEVLRGRFIEIQSYLKKQEKHRINSNSPSKEAGKRRTKNPQSQQKEQIER